MMDHILFIIILLILMTCDLKFVLRFVLITLAFKVFFNPVIESDCTNSDNVGNCFYTIKK